MPCYRCGTRQTDPARGHSPWQRGVRGDQVGLALERVLGRGAQPPARAPLS